MDQAKFDEEVGTLVPALRLALTSAQMAGGRLVAYNAWLDSTEVIVLGFQMQGELSHVDTKPLALLMTEDLFDRVKVSAGDVLKGGESQPHLIKED